VKAKRKIQFNRGRRGPTPWSRKAARPVPARKIDSPPLDTKSIGSSTSENLRKGGSKKKGLGNASCHRALVLKIQKGIPAIPLCLKKQEGTKECFQRCAGSRSLSLRGRLLGEENALRCGSGGSGLLDVWKKNLKRVGNPNLLIGKKTSALGWGQRSQGACVKRGFARVPSTWESPISSERP